MNRTARKQNDKSRKIIPVILVLLLVLLSALLFYLATWPRYLTKHFYGDMTEELKDSELYEDLQSGKSVCFVGDSITAGSSNWGVTWFEPLRPYIKGDISNVSGPGATTGDIIACMDTIPNADIYIIAIGVNDVMFPNDADCASTGEEYVSNLEIIADHLSVISPGSKIYFIAPWILMEYPEDVNNRRNEFADALSDWCNGTDRICIDPYPVLYSVIQEEGSSRYMYDNVHPNIRHGVGLYSYAVLYQEHQRRSVS